VKYLRWTLLVAACLLWSGAAFGQSVDAFFGFDTLITGVSSPAGVPKLGGGFYPSFSADVMFLPHGLGISGLVAWRGAMADYFGEGERPVYYTFNLMWQPIAPGNKIRPDFSIGAGGESLRFYTGEYSCSFISCTDYTSSNHGVLHAGAGVKIYVHGNFFLRPSLDYYAIRHNYEFGVPISWQTGVAIGYTLGPSS
jgi:hypothetical protein